MRSALLLIAACGRLDFAPTGDGSLAIGDAHADALGPCTAWNAFGAPTLAHIPGNIAHYFGSLTDDGTIAFFDDYGGATLFDDLYFASRPTPTDPFGNETLIAELQTNDGDYAPVTRDGLTVYFGREAGGTGAAEIMVTSRTSLTAMFSAPTPINELNSPSRDVPGWISPDGLRMYMASDRTGDLEIYVATRATPTSTWNTPAILPELVGNGDDDHPSLTEDEREIIWSSKRVGPRYDIYHATRATTADPFGTPAPIAQLDTANDDCFSWLTPDGTTLYFNYNSTSAARRCAALAPSATAQGPVQPESSARPRARPVRPRAPQARDARRSTG